MFGHYIKRRGLEELKNYQYKSGGYTSVDRLLNYWWELAVRLVPSWVAPNVLTLIGFLCSVVSFTVLLYYCPNLREEGPPWIYYLVALLTFLHQTFDAIDGKQARRTGTSSPLGQLFDHGCDVMLITVASLTTLGVTCAGVGIRQFFVVVISTQIHQFIYMWWEYHFHIFFASTGPVGVTEAQLGMIVCSLLSAVFGPAFYGIDLFAFLPPSLLPFLKSAFPFLPSTFLVRDLLIWWLIIMNSFVALYDMVLGIYRAKHPKLATAQLISLGVFQWVQWLFYRKCLLTELQLPSYLVYYVMSTAYSIFVIRLCLSSTCKISFSPIQWPVFPFFVCVALLHYLPSSVFLPVFGVSLSYPIAVLLVLSIWNTVYLVDILVTSVRDICSYLQIPCFTIPKAPTKKTT